jgi:hypothetical protein
VGVRSWQWFAQESDGWGRARSEWFDLRHTEGAHALEGMAALTLKKSTGNADVKVSVADNGVIEWQADAGNTN